MEKSAIAVSDDHCYRNKVHLHLTVDVVTKRDQRTGQLTRGKVRWILTSKPFHSRGIKVMLEDRTVGRVQRIINENELLSGE
jgi:uncharacterized repeat protein (TIGR03833 family)